jgi:hypothetical protein
MPPVAKATRGVSPILFVLAALCFLLPFAAISCNTAAASSAASALGSLGGSSTSPAQSACLNQLSSGKDFVTYSGVNMVTGSDPSNDLSSCTQASSSSSSSDKGSIGVQPLLLIALILIVVGAVSAALRAPLRLFVAGGAALLAFILVLVNNSTAHNAISNKLTSSGSGSSGSLGSLGIGSIDTFFNIHAALGVTLALIALGLAFAANAIAFGLGLRPATGTPPPPGAPWQPPPPSQTSPPGAGPPGEPRPDTGPLLDAGPGGDPSGGPGDPSPSPGAPLAPGPSG